jgi:sulfhydrogenase subunit beta (sulfur reductase)
MAVRTINKDDLQKLFASLRGWDIRVPVTESGVTTFKKLDGDLDLDFANSQKPPKEVFFPQTEKMFDFVKEGKRFVDVKEVEVMSQDGLVFGMRPCDARAMNILDRLFAWDYKDKYYLARREHFTIIGLACTGSGTPTPNCFCTSLGGDPASTEGLDMLWTDIGDSYLVESLTPKGERILELGSGVFTEAGDAPIKEAEAAKQRGRNAISRTLEVEGVKEVLERTFTSAYWDQFSKRCLGCGICTLLCPTCHCFDINDIVTLGKGWRERTWDSCQYPYYTLHASGHNPRPEKKHRQRNRIYHKFQYMVDNLDVVGCVGCGRCITNCPVNIDIIEVLEGVKEVKADES